MVFEGKSEFQAFFDGYPNNVALFEFPQCPIWHDLRYYLVIEDVFWPVITLPAGRLRDHKNNFSDVSYKEIFLPLRFTYTCMPPFRRSGFDSDSFTQVPAFQQKINDLRILIQFAKNSRECYMGYIIGVV